MNGSNSQVDSFFHALEKWQDELVKLRAIVLDCLLTEELKWNVPIYTHNNANIIGINGLKDFCAISFFKGVLLSDPEHLLERPGEYTQEGRWIKFADVQQIVDIEPTLKAYIFEAIENEKAGLKAQLKTTAGYEVPEELQQKWLEMPAFKAAFDALTPGRQRGYLIHFAQPKQSKTRQARIEKLIPQIMAGKGLNDR